MNPLKQYLMLIGLIKELNMLKQQLITFWETNLSGYTGIMMPDEMEPEIRDADAWEKYFRGEIDMDSVRTRVQKFYRNRNVGRETQVLG